MVMGVCGDGVVSSDGGSGGCGGLVMVVEVVVVMRDGRG